MWIALVLALVGVASYVGARASRRWGIDLASRHSVLLISIDTLRADAVGFQDPSVKNTPHLEAFAEDATVFVQATAAANHTAPSHASMLTGFSPASHGVVNTIKSSPIQIPETLPTLAERFRSAGYATRGDTDSGYMRPEFGFDRGFDEFRCVNEGIQAKVNTALAWIGANHSERPWFYFLHTYAVHGPYLLPRSIAEAVLEKYPKSWVPQEYRKLFDLPSNELLGHGLDYLRDPSKFGPQDRACLEALYAAAVGLVDEQLGRLFDELERRPEWDSLLVVVTSDHGEEFLEHGHLQHVSMFDEIMRVPLVVKFPGRLAAGARVPWPFAGIDLTPTVAEAAGIGAPREVEGTSHFGAVRGLDHEGKSPKAPRSVAFGNHFDGERLAADVARSPLTKVFVQRFRSSDVLKAFDLVKDPNEYAPTMPDTLPEGPQLVEELRDRRNVWDATFDVHGRKARRGVKSATLDRDLKNLGYAK